MGSLVGRHAAPSRMSAPLGGRGKLPPAGRPGANQVDEHPGHRVFRGESTAIRARRPKPAGGSADQQGNEVPVITDVRQWQEAVNHE